DTVRVEPGSYEGNLALSKPLVLEGVGNPVIRGSGTGSVVLVAASGCAIRGFTIERSGGDLQQEDSGILLKSDGNRVEDNSLADVLYGIYLYGSRNNTVRRNVIRGRRELEIGERGAGLHLWNSPGNLIEGNTISEARDGLYIQSSPGNTILRNRIFRLRYGVHYMFSESNSFEDNTFSDNVAGAAIMYSNHISFRRNAFVHNRGFSSFGILFQDCERCLAEGNFLIDNATGIFMEALRYSTFRGNVIAGNDVALQMFSSADENVFTCNNFVQNLSPLQLIGRSSTTRWSMDGRGNYWSDYDGYDLNGDGIGDVPHRIQNLFEYMEGNHPRLRLYLESPSAHALALAEKAFPIVQMSREVDRAPLMAPQSIRYRSESRKTGAPAAVAAVLSLGTFIVGLVFLWWGQRG
ncbi:MAG TPA: nitrous oxide reductase family maturation protein NosD, partial [Acidobacteriota bacterium]|nr:nitrous oxide reductase family maturation protein NosD [Acidobacteriota bacterium]